MKTETKKIITIALVLLALLISVTLTSCTDIDTCALLASSNTAAGLSSKSCVEDK